MACLPDSSSGAPGASPGTPPGTPDPTDASSGTAPVEAGVTSEGGTPGPGPAVVGLQFPLDTIPTARVKPFGVNTLFDCGISGGQYRAAIEDGGLDRSNLSLQYTFWSRSTALPGDGDGSPVYWTSLRNPQNLICVERNTGTDPSYILANKLGSPGMTPQPFPGAEAACGWEIVRNPADHAKYAFKSLLFPPQNGKAAYLGNYHSGGTGGRFYVVIVNGNQPITSNEALVPWFTFHGISP